ncbi:glycoside hydrolase family 88 protein [Niabella ginsengisoli]|uniref:Glycoside hydrolase family 88 protein n=1 Tax=Niabella ginsengisoli TaxID=522298 RepID=A0ABS9SQT9_9BACT|nr:glycoside hydrolase family 88 protein [Niabella ginsengisoli]MCH5600764.1 glycoside hydrolase family 88 protein [Niabella ginsengisoli]
MIFQKITKPLFASVLLFVTSLAVAQTGKESQQEIYASLEKVADWQIENMWIKGHSRNVYHPTNWTNGALFAGMMKWANLSNDTTYISFLKK